VNLFIEHTRHGHGGLFIDPHGDTADQIVRLIPKNRMRDFIWIDPERWMTDDAAPSRR
jgi:hypothetical protein